MPALEASSRYTVTFGCSCRKEAGTLGMTGPSTALATVLVLFSPKASRRISLACTAHHQPWYPAQYSTSAPCLCMLCIYSRQAAVRCSPQLESALLHARQRAQAYASTACRNRNEHIMRAAGSVSCELHALFMLPSTAVSECTAEQAHLKDGGHAHGDGFLGYMAFPKEVAGRIHARHPVQIHRSRPRVPC